MSWLPGEYLGLDMPAHADALGDGGATFLTEASDPGLWPTTTRSARSRTSASSAAAAPDGDNGIERHYAKCVDYAMPEPVAHYQATNFLNLWETNDLVGALADVQHGRAL